MAIAAAGHGAPTPASRARGITKKEPTRRVGADAKAHTWAFGDDFSGGASNSSEQPIQTVFASHEFQAPGTALLEKFVVPFGDSQDFVDGFDPVTVNRFLAEQRTESFMQGCMQLLGFAENCAGALRIVLGKSEQLGATL
ncbi:MAG: hypothetical protein WA736_11155 [Candidatus Acidiferrum sp.]